jgi:hypothetical protein
MYKKSKEIPEVIEKEMNIVIPYNVLRKFYLSAFELDIKNRKRKEKPKVNEIVFEFESGEVVKIALKNEEELDVNVPTDQESTTIQEEEAVEETVTAEVEQEEDDWNVNQTETRQEPVNFQF